MKKIIISILLCAVFCLQPVYAAADTGGDAVLHPSLAELLDLYIEYSLYEVGRDDAILEMISKLLADEPALIDYLGEALLTARDQYGGYYSGTSTGEFFSSDVYYGYGIRLDGKPAENGQKYNTAIAQVFGYSPAEQAGLKVGDEIIKINGADFSDFGMQAVSHMLASGDRAEITVNRNGDLKTFSLSKSNVFVPAVDLQLFEEEKTALVKIEHFKETDLFYDFYAILKYIESLEYENLIIDLRGNPGGAFSVMLECLNLLVTEEDVVLCSAVFKDGEPNAIDSTGEGVSFDKICVLVNGASASAAEIFAISLGEITGAAIIGETTYGKGVGQEVFDLSNGGAAFITSFEILSANGNRYNKIGVVPGIKIAPDYRDAKKTGLGKLNFVNCRTIKKGAENDAVLALNMRLAAIGYLPLGDVTNKCADNTVTAVEIFQRYNNLPVGIDKIDYAFLERLELFISRASVSRYEERDVQLECAFIYTSEGEAAASEFAAGFEG